MDIKYVVLSLLSVTYAMATLLTWEQIMEGLIAAEGEDLERTFEMFEKEEGEDEDDGGLRDALEEMAKKKEHIPKVVRCLQIAKDPDPKNASQVSLLVNNTVYNISRAINIETFAGIVASFKLSAVKLLASIRYYTIRRKDAREVLERVMIESPERIIDSLPMWLASHGFDRKSVGYNYSTESFRKQTFDYLASHATERILREALAIANKNEHYETIEKVVCCYHRTTPHDRIRMLEALLQTLKARKERTKEVLSLFLPSVLVNMILVDVYAA